MRKRTPRKKGKGKSSHCHPIISVKVYKLAINYGIINGGSFDMHIIVFLYCFFFFINCVPERERSTDFSLLFFKRNFINHSKPSCYDPFITKKQRKKKQSQCR